MLRGPGTDGCGRLRTDRLCIGEEEKKEKEKMRPRTGCVEGIDEEGKN